MKHQINPNNVDYSASNKGKRSVKDFFVFDDFAVGLGLEIGCGTNRFSNTVLAIDRSMASSADLICDASVLPFRDGRFDFIFSSHCLKDFDNPLSVMGEWLRVIKPLGYLLILLPNMENARNWQSVAKFKSTLPHMFGLITKSPAKLMEYFYLENSTSFGVVIQKLPCKRTEYKLAYTPYGRAVVLTETPEIVSCIYEDKTTRIFNRNEVSFTATFGYPDLLSIIQEA